MEPTLALPDTGDIRADLLSQLLAFVQVMTRTPGGRILAELIGKSQTDEQLATAFRADADIDSLALSLVGGGHLLFADRDPSLLTTATVSKLVTTVVADVVRRRHQSVA